MVGEGVLERNLVKLAGIFREQHRRIVGYCQALCRIPETQGFRSTPHGVVTVRAPALAGGIYGERFSKEAINDD